MSIKIDQALIKHYVDSNFGVPTAYENEHLDTGGNAWAELIVAPNDVTPLNLSHTNETDGAFRVVLSYPKDSGSIEIKQKADEILAAYPIGARLTYDGVEVKIVSIKRSLGEQKDAWYKITVTMAYRAFFPRN